MLFFLAFDVARRVRPLAAFFFFPPAFFFRAALFAFGRDFFRRGAAGFLGSSGENGDGVGSGLGDGGIEGNEGSIIPGPDQPVSSNSACTNIGRILR